MSDQPHGDDPDERGSGAGGSEAGGAGGSDQPDQSGRPPQGGESERSPRASGSEGRQRVSLNVSEELKHGQYANFLVVSHSPHEFTLDFCQLSPGDGSGQVRAEVVSRVKIPPTVVGKIIRALNTNLTNYEDKYGMVKDVG